MSLVEQAIARMRNQARAAVPKNAATGSAPAVPPPIVDQVAEPAATPAKRMTLNMDALRDRGYLPEAGQDKQFADHYRRINTEGASFASVCCPSCAHEFDVDLIGSRLGGS